MAIRLKPRYSHKAHIDLTALIDLVFLLVAFFMVTSSLGSESLISVKLPRAEQTGPYERGSVIVSVNEKNEVFINDKKISLSDFKSQIVALKGKDKKLRVVIRGDRKASYQTIVNVMDFLNQANVPVFTLSTIQN